MSFNVPVRPTVSFRGLRQRGESNPHGWGMAFYPDKSAHVMKEPVEAKRSPLSEFLQNYQKIESKIFIGHVRYTSVGSVSHMNTHPFYRELEGKEFVFAHNGTLSNYNSLVLKRFKPIGETDSEYAFCYLLSSIEEEGITTWSRENFDWLAAILKEINKYGSFNCIFSDGEFLFCYHDKDGYNGLCLVQRKPPYNSIRLLDEDWEINLAEEKRPGQTGYIVATERLTDEQWENFKPAELIVFKDGKIIYSNLRNISETLKVGIATIEKKILKIIRKNPHKVSLKKIIESLDYSTDEIKSAVHSLLCKGYIRQDRRDKVEYNHEDATFFTESSKREEIDRLIA